MRYAYVFLTSALSVPLTAVIIAACTSSSGGTPSGNGGDAAPGAGDAAADASGGGACDAADIDSGCGQPCDQGNALGVGRFCNTFSDCAGTANPSLCSSLGDITTHFCTFACTPSDAGAPCGEGATCRCNDGGQCGCTPNQCLSNPG